MHLTVLLALQVTMLPSSPAELLRHIQSDGYKQAQADQAQRVRRSFEVGPLRSKDFQVRAVLCWKKSAPLVPIQARVHEAVHMLPIEVKKACCPWSEAVLTSFLPASETLTRGWPAVQILEGSPWLQSQPVYVLAVQQPDSKHGLTYTLRVRVSKPEAENELSRVSNPLRTKS